MCVAACSVFSCWGTGSKTWRREDEEEQKDVGKTKLGERIMVVGEKTAVRANKKEQLIDTKPSWGEGSL